AAGPFQACSQLLVLLVKINGLKKLLDSLCAHSHAECAAPFFSCFLVLLLGEHLFVHQVCLSYVQHNVGGKVEHFLQRSGGQIQDQSHTAGNSLEVPDM